MTHVVFQIGDCALGRWALMQTMGSTQIVNLYRENAAFRFASNKAINASAIVIYEVFIQQISYCCSDMEVGCMKIIVTIFLSTAFTFSAMAQPYIGEWASNQKKCRDKNSEANTQFKKGLFIAHETFCKISSLKRPSANSWSAKAACEGEGEKWPLRLDFSVSGDRLLLSQDGGPAEKLIRCIR